MEPMYLSIRQKETGKQIKKPHLKNYPDAFYDFQFTILRILPKNVTDKEAINIESTYKNKLCTRNSYYGLNRN